MNRKASKQVHYDSGPNMTPLVDVVMVILIFLMLAGSFGTTEHFMASTLPDHSGGSPAGSARVAFSPPIRVDVHISPNGDATVLGAFTREPDPERVRAALAAKLAQLKAVNADDPKKADTIEAVLRPSPGTKWENLAALYDAAVRANFARVSFAQAQQGL